MLSGFLKKLLFARQFMIDQGKIEVLGKRQIMLPFELLTSLQDIDKKKSYSIIKSTITQTMGYYAKKIGTTSSGMLKSSEEIFETFGMGKIQVVKLDNAKKNAAVRVTNFPPCAGKSDPCEIYAGALAGMFSFLFSKDIDAEIKVRPTGAQGYCEFIIK